MNRRVSLDVIDIEEPCSEPWERMTGDDRRRFCGTCRMNVYDLSALTREEAERFLAEREGQPLCVQLVRRADGTVVTADCTPSRLAKTRRAARRSLAFACALVAATLGAALGLVGLGRASCPAEREHHGKQPASAHSFEVRAQPLPPRPPPQSHHHILRGRRR